VSQQQAILDNIAIVTSIVIVLQMLRTVPQLIVTWWHLLASSWCTSLLHSMRYNRFLLSSLITCLALTNKRGRSQGVPWVIKPQKMIFLRENRKTVLNYMQRVCVTIS